MVIKAVIFIGLGLQPSGYNPSVRGAASILYNQFL